MIELEKLLRINQKLGPSNQDKNFIEIRCYCDFEGHGRASENWEKHWELILPMQQAYWKSTAGWKICNEGIKAKFHGKNFEDVLKRAKQFLAEINEQQKTRNEQQ